MKLLAALIILVCTLSLQTAATPITRQQARQNALDFLALRGKNIAVTTLRSATMLTAETGDDEPLYLFNIGDNQGYVIVSGDDCAPAVLGYSDHGSVGINNMPENMRWWLDEYARQIQFMRKNSLSSSRARTGMASMPAIPPLLTTGWDQTSPFNLHCPLTPNGSHYVTGCVATAMAQVLYYHRANSVSQTTHEMPAYYTPGGVYVDAIPAGSFIDWDNMLNSYFSGTATEVQNDAVAWLMRYCGSAVHMQYATGSSSAHMSSVAPAMIAYFNYGSRAETMARNGCGLSDEEWENLVYSELSNSRPVLYSGSKPSTSGHAFVCDGYDGEGFFHINWGWTFTQGYYRLTAIDSIGTSVLGYNLNQQGVFFAEPRPNLPLVDDGISFADPIARAICLQSGDDNDDGTLTMEEILAIDEMGPFESTGLSSFDEFKYFTGITSVRNMMFAYCGYLESITLPDHITTIGKSAFLNCHNLKAFTLPCSVTLLQSQAFFGCDNLKRFTWNARNCGLEFMSSFPTSVEYLTFGDSVNVIPNNVAKNANIKELTIGKSVTRIGTSAFYECTGLKRVVIPNSVTTISTRAFYKCTGLEGLALGKSVLEIGDRAFEACSNLKSVSIPNSVTGIGSYAFRDCTNLKRAVIGNSVTSLKSMAFAGCDSLKAVTCLVPVPLSINENVFKGLYDKAILRVPAYAVEAYKATSPWNKFAEIVPIDPTMGDVNLDGNTDIVDVTDLISQVLTSDTTEFGDVNSDGEVNIADVVILIDIIMGNTK